MEIKVYREKVQDKGTYKSHKGEDGKPYVGKRAIMAADGLGGSAAIRHVKFNRGLFHKEELMDTLFKGVYEDYSDKEFENYVLESFADFCAMDEEQYFKDILSMKKGGYFGSRIVTAITLYEILHSEWLWKEGDDVWDKVHAAKNVDELKAVQEEIGGYFAKKIKEKLALITREENANLFYESTVSGLALLGTTLCATLYNERDGYVETLYLEAGDSRPYIIDEGGMAQVIADQEGDDGAMNNCIKANAEFGVYCEYRRFNKPCILLNVSDGCFDSSAFPTQLTFEKLILDCIVGNETEGMEGMREYDGEEERIAEQLRAFFEIHGRHDDSSTIAMKSFGFADLDEVKEFAKKRLAKIEEQYLQGDPDIIKVDYADEEQRLEEETTRKLAGKRAALWNETSVQEYCKDLVLNKAASQEYETAKTAAANKTSACGEKIAELQTKAAEMIKPYYLSILDAEGVVDLSDCKELKKCKERKQHAEEIIAEIHECAEEYQAKLDAAKETLVNALNAAKEKDLNSSSMEVDGEIRKVFELQSEIKGLLESLESGKGRNKDISVDLKIYHVLNAKAADADEKKSLKAGETDARRSLKGLAKRIDSLKEVVVAVVFVEKAREEILAVIDEISAAKAEMAGVQNELAQKLEEAAKKYWERNFKQVMESIYTKGVPEVSETEKAEIDAIFSDTKMKDKMAASLEKQKELFAAYEKEYNRVMESDLELSEEGKLAAEEAPVETKETAEEETPVEEAPVETAEEPAEEVEETSVETEEESTEEVEEAPVEETAEKAETKEEVYEEEPEDLPVSETEENPADGEIE